MSAFAERRLQDVQKLQALAAGSGGKIRVLKTAGSPVSTIELELNFRTAGGKSYPAEARTSTVCKIVLPARYPFVEPSVEFTTAVFHPNVWTSGRVCLGVKWLPTQGLDLLVNRLIQILTFDETILNEQSPANTDALGWYRTTKRKHPAAFPTDTLRPAATSSGPKMNWSDVSSAPQRVTKACPICHATLSLPPGRTGLVKCPKCANPFEVST